MQIMEKIEDRGRQFLAVLSRTATHDICEIFRQAAWLAYVRLYPAIGVDNRGPRVLPNGALSICQKCWWWCDDGYTLDPPATIVLAHDPALGMSALKKWSRDLHRLCDWIDANAHRYIIPGPAGYQEDYWRFDGGGLPEDNETWRGIPVHVIGRGLYEPATLRLEADDLVSVAPWPDTFRLTYSRPLRGASLWAAHGPEGLTHVAVPHYDTQRIRAHVLRAAVARREAARKTGAA